MDNIRIMRTYTIELDLAERIDNVREKSKLINELLRKYFEEVDANEGGNGSGD